MNSNPSNANTDTVKGERKELSTPSITTQTLGIANERVRDLTGLVLNPEEITTAVVKFLMATGIDNNDIYSVKVGTTKDNELRIIAEIRAKALSNKKNDNNSWMDFNEYDTDESLVSDYFYRAWRNKFYHGKNKHLQLKKIKREGGNCVAVNIDPAIFLAFVYDINFCDRYYKISAPAVRWKSSKQLDNMSGKERKKYKVLQQEFSNYGITQCFVVITYAIPERIKYTTPKGDVVIGFHPCQVDEYYSNK